MTWSGFLLDISAQNMGEGLHEVRLAGNKYQQIGDADTRHLAIERAVDRLFFRRIDQRSAALVVGSRDLDVLVVTVFKPPVDKFELLFEIRMEGRDRLFDRCQQDRRADLLKHGSLVLPLLRTDEIALEAANSLLSRTYRLPASRAFRKTESIDEELVAVDMELPVLALLGLGVHIGVRQEVGGRRG